MTGYSAKRTFDVIAASAGLVVLAPLLLLLVVMVRATTPGPAIFRQRRVGRHESTFLCLKLRTMHSGTLDLPTHEVAMSAVTPLGAWLRRFKLDELPQLLNVLYGEMSLVGPRPCLPSQVELVVERRNRGVLALRPGMTGVSQVEGIDMSTPQRLALSDATYLADMSFMGDLRIIVRTVLQAIRKPKGHT